MTAAPQHPITNLIATIHTNARETEAMRWLRLNGPIAAREAEAMRAEMGEVRRG